MRVQVPLLPPLGRTEPCVPYDVRRPLLRGRGGLPGDRSGPRRSRWGALGRGPTGPRRDGLDEARGRRSSQTRSPSRCVAPPSTTTRRSGVPHGLSQPRRRRLARTVRGAPGTPQLRAAGCRAPTRPQTSCSTRASGGRATRVSQREPPASTRYASSPKSPHRTAREMPASHRNWCRLLRKSAPFTRCV